MSRKPLWVLALGVSLSLPAAAQPAGTERRVNTNTTAGGSLAGVAWKASSGFVVVWRSFGPDGDYDGVFGRRFSPLGAALGAEFLVNTYTTGNQFLAAVARSSAGPFVVVWTDESEQDGSYGGIFAQRFDETGAPAGGEFTVNTTTKNNQTEPAVAAGPKGSFVVVWRSEYQEYETDPGGIYGQRFDTDGLPLGDEFHVNDKGAEGQFLPAVAEDSNGRFMVVWNNDTALVGARFDADGAKLGGDFEIADGSVATDHGSRVAASDDGAFVVAYSRSLDGSFFGIYAQRYGSDGTPLGGEFRVNTVTSGNQRYPGLAMDDAGNFAVTWSGAPDAAYDVFVQRFRANGTPLGTELRVNTYTPGAQYRTAAAASPTGRFAVVWQSNPQDSGVNNVYSQRFLAIVAPRGDANGDGVISVSDILYLINHLFAGGPAPIGPGDVNGDETTTVSDVLYLINHLFAGGPAPV